jgi:hypothetical protein
MSAPPVVSVDPTSNVIETKKEGGVRPAIGPTMPSNAPPPPQPSGPTMLSRPSTDRPVAATSVTPEPAFVRPPDYGPPQAQYGAYAPHANWQAPAKKQSSNVGIVLLIVFFVGAAFVGAAVFGVLAIVDGMAALNTNSDAAIDAGSTTIVPPTVALGDAGSNHAIDTPPSSKSVAVTSIAKSAAPANSQPPLPLTARVPCVAATTPCVAPYGESQQGLCQLPCRANQDCSTCVGGMGNGVGVCIVDAPGHPTRPPTANEHGFCTGPSPCMLSDTSACFKPYVVLNAECRQTCANDGDCNRCLGKCKSGACY